MARPLNVRRLNAIEVQQLQKRLAGLANLHQQRRAEALLLYGMGLDPLRIAQAQSVHLNTIYADLHAFATSGIEAVTHLQSGGAPTPIRYRTRGSSASASATTSRVAAISALLSPTDRPPMAIPSNARPATAAALSRRSAGSTPPWTMPNRAWSLRVRAARQRSAQRWVRVIASATWAAGRVAFSAALNAPVEETKFGVFRM